VVQFLGRRLLLLRNVVTVIAEPQQFTAGYAVDFSARHTSG